MSCSNENSGVWTPMTTNPSSRYASDQARTYGSWRSQLMHVHVQKFTRTTWPRSSAAVMGSELSQTAARSRPSSGWDDNVLDVRHIAVGGRRGLVRGAPALASVDVGRVPVPPVVRRGDRLECAVTPGRLVQ